MSERIKGFTVIVETMIREDDFDDLKNAVLMLKGVQQVVPYYTRVEDTLSRIATINEVKSKLFEFTKSLD